MTAPDTPGAESQARAAETRANRPASRQRPGSGVSRWWNDQPRWLQWVYLLPVVALVYSLPILNPPLLSTEPGSDFAITCFEMAKFALIAIGLNIVVGYAGLLDLGYVAFFAVGAYVAAMLTSPDSPYVKIPYLWTLPVAMVVAAFAGVFLGVSVLRLRGDYLAIVTLGFGEIIRILATIIPQMKGQVGFQNVGRPPGTNADGTPLFVNSDGRPWYWLTVTVIIIVLVFVGNLERSRVGRSWIAIREDEDAAEIMGVPTFRYKVWAFALGASLGGLSGALAAGQIGFVNNQRFDVQTSILFLAAVVLGGQGNKVGAIVGGAIVAYIPYRFTEVANYKYLIFGIILVLLMLFRSEGLIPARMHLLTYSRRARHWIASTLGGARRVPGHTEGAAS